MVPLNEVARAAPGFPAPELGFRAQFIAQLQAVTQRGGDIDFAASRGHGVAEMGFIVHHDLIDLGGRETLKTLTQPSDE